MTDLAALTPDDFAVGDRLTLPDGTAVELTEVTPLPWTQDAPRAPFSLTFAGADLSQGIHALSHERLGLLEIFLVPIAPGCLEATFG